LAHAFLCIVCSAQCIPGPTSGPTWCLSHFLDDERKQENKRKASGQPKRTMSSYIFFTDDKRAAVTKKNKDAKMTDISNLMGAMWRSTNEAGRAKYTRQAEDDKARYVQEMAAWDGAQKNQDWLS
jgi:hypothetical protein